jgi:hypothetical protein
MTLEKSQIKFARSEETGEIIGFVSRHSKTKRLKGVRESSHYGKKICVLSEDLKGKIIPNVLYDVELKQMHNQNGYVVVSATPVKFKGQLKTIISKGIYQVTITFGNKTIYFDPVDGKSSSSKTIEGVVEILRERQDIADLDSVIKEFKTLANELIARMQKDNCDFDSRKKKKK